MDLKERCEWEVTDPEFGMWETSCDNSFLINVGSPIHNGMLFCCYCGHPLKEIQ